MVKGTASADDPKLQDYWRKRELTKVKDLVPSKQKLASRQKGGCPVCGESLFNEEEVQIHHILPKAKGGKNHYGNLELVHLFCHHQIPGRLNEQDKTMKPCRE